MGRRQKRGDTKRLAGALSKRGCLTREQGSKRPIRADPGGRPRRRRSLDLSLAARRGDFVRSAPRAAQGARIASRRGGGRFLFARYGGLSKRFLLFIINSIVSREARRADFLAARPGRYQRMKRRAQQDGRPLEGRQALLAQTRRHRALLRRNAGHRGAVGGLKNATGTPRDMPWTPPRRARWGEGRTAQRERSTGDPAQRRWGA